MDYIDNRLLRGEDDPETYRARVERFWAGVDGLLGDGDAPD